MFKKALAAFFAVILIALFWRLDGITFDSLWLDEAYQTMIDVYCVALPEFTEVPVKPYVFKFGTPVSSSQMLSTFRTMDLLSPPLYPLMLNRWVTAFGGSDFAVRTLSVTISLLCLSVLFGFVYGVFGLRAAVLVGLLQAFSPYDITYAQEVRMYSLVELTAGLTCCSLIWYLVKQPRGWLGWCFLLAYAVGAWAMINSHYTGLFVFMFTVVLGFGFVLGRRDWRLLAKLIGAWALIAVLWFPWLGMFRQSAALRTASFYVARSPSWWWPPYALFLRIPTNWLDFLSGKQVVAYAIPVYLSAAVTVLLAMAVPFLRVARKLRLRLDRTTAFDRYALIAYVCVWLWALIPAIGLWSIDVVENHKVIQYSRYVIGTAPAIFIIAGVALARLSWKSPAFITILAAQLVFASVNNIAHSTVVHQREPWRQMARIVETECAPDQLLLVSQYYDVVCLNRYLQKPFLQLGISPQMGAAHVDKVLGNARGFSLLTAQDGESEAELIPLRFKQTKKFDLEHGLHLRIYTANF